MRRLRSFAGRRGGSPAAPGPRPAAAALAAPAPTSAPGRPVRTAPPSLVGGAGGALSLRAPRSAAGRPPHPAAVSRRGGGAARGRSAPSRGGGPVFWPLRPPAPARSAAPAAASSFAADAANPDFSDTTSESKENL
jgi:hypothetical protein